MDFHLVPRGTDRNYTGFFTKTIVYSGTLVIFIACKFQRQYLVPSHPILSYPSSSAGNAKDKPAEPLTSTICTAFALTISSIVIPRWISYHSEKVSWVVLRRAINQ